MCNATHDAVNTLMEEQKQMIVQQFISQEYAGLWNELTQEQRNEIEWLALSVVDELCEDRLPDMSMRLSEKWNSTILKNIGRQ